MEGTSTKNLMKMENSFEQRNMYIDLTFGTSHNIGVAEYVFFSNFTFWQKNTSATPGALAAIGSRRIFLLKKIFGLGYEKFAKGCLHGAQGYSFLHRIAWHLSSNSS